MQDARAVEITKYSYTQVYTRYQYTRCSVPDAPPCHSQLAAAERQREVGSHRERQTTDNSAIDRSTYQEEQQEQREHHNARKKRIEGKYAAFFVRILSRIRNVYIRVWQQQPAAWPFFRSEKPEFRTFYVQQNEFRNFKT